MIVIALYNMKGGVGKTTTAVNLSYLAATGGQRTLLWDLDPQAASSFAFRVRPQVKGFNKKTLGDGESLIAAIKETDYPNLDLLPADFAYRKLERLLSRFDKPKRLISELLATLGRDYDLVFLDCPAGFSLLSEGIFGAADVLLIPTIPTVLSLRTLAHLIKWADRSDATTALVPFFSMVDRRKGLHRSACEWPGSRDIFMAAQIPYASVVEQMTVRRMPLSLFAAREPAAIAFANVWKELRGRLAHRDRAADRSRGRWLLQLQAIESLIARLESAESQNSAALQPPANKPVATQSASAATDLEFIHTFDTVERDLQRCGYLLELREHGGRFTVSATSVDVPATTEEPVRAEARIDGWWATQIIAGSMCPLAVLERRLNPAVSLIIQRLRATVREKPVVRVESRHGQAATALNPAKGRAIAI
jgi:cellulose biosynthesis protein BcsQ